MKKLLNYQVLIKELGLLLLWLIDQEFLISEHQFIIE